MAKFGAIELVNEPVDDAAYFFADPGDDVFDTFSDIDPDEPRNEVNGKRNGLTKCRFDTRSRLANTLIQFSKSLFGGRVLCLRHTHNTSVYCIL